VAKNIILLADGTGNSASSPFKTNVWRLYQAVDIGTAPAGALQQVVHYDNGVGTETFKPLQLLGLALGIGVAANVKNLYSFLCRNYKPGDNIFLFGFSRGAFTVRILAGLVLRCGVVTAPNEGELEERVKLAYAEYKRDVARRATATRPWLLAGRILGGWKTGQTANRVSFNFEHHFPRIAVMGVWDTVDAYGMPVDELKEGIDRYVWPMTLADRGLSDYVDRVCHALSLDDERPTFRPVLWTDPAKSPERLSQVWFAGVHANVGGGYPDDGLAYVTLQWIMDEAAQCGLRFYPDLRTEYNDRADPHGAQYDSRSGSSGYYRYGPRDMDSLCDDPDHGVTVAHVQVHESVLERIRRWQVAYAPVCISRKARGYELCGRSENPPVLAARPPVESAPDIKGRAHDMELVRDAVFRRRVAYFFTVALTIVLGALPLFDWLADHVWTPASEWLSATVPTAYVALTAPISWLAWMADQASHIPGWSAVTHQIGRALQWTINEQLFPAWVTVWLQSFGNHPSIFLLCGLSVLWLFVRKSQLLQEQVFVRAEYAWRRIAPNAPGNATKVHEKVPTSTWTDPIVRRVRTNRAAVAVYGWLSRRVVPMLFALFVAAPISMVIAPFFIPKFLRNLARRRRYKVQLRTDALERIAGTSLARG
jgi:uncharacterized protein (DUF2235 family)